MFSFKSVYFVIFTIIFHLSHAKLSDKRLCVDEKCSVPISEGRTLLKYHSPEEGLLSFGPNLEVKVYSYGAGTNPELLGVEIEGKRGYVNKMFIRETKLLKHPKLLVDTELASNSEVPSISESVEIKTDPPLEPYEIVDGTKIPLNDLTDNVVEVAPSNGKVESTTPLPSIPVPEITDKPISDDPLSSIPPIPKPKENPLEDQEDDDGDEEEDDEESDDDEEDESEETQDSKPVAVLAAEALSEQPKQEPVNLSNEIKVENDNVASNLSESVEVTTKENSIPIVQPIEKEFSEANTKETLEITSSNEASNSLESNNTTLETNTTDTENSLPDALTDSNQPPSAISIEPIVETVQEINEESNQSLPATSDITSKEEATEEKPLQLDLNIVPTTEIPLEVEAPSIDLDVVTEDPLAASVEQTVTEISEPLNVEVSNEDKSEDVDSVVEQPGILGGLKNIFPMFGGGGVKTDEIEQPAAQDVLNQVADQEVYAESEAVEQIQTDAESDIQDVLSEKVKEPDEIKNEPTEIVDDEKSPVIEDTLKEDQLEESQSSDEGFFAGLQSFFGFGSDSKNDEMKPSQPDAVANYLYSSLSNEHTDTPSLSDIPFEAPVNQVCDSKSDKCPQIAKSGFCNKDSEDCQTFQNSGNVAVESGKFTRNFSTENLEEIFIEAFSSDLFLYLTTTSLSVLVLIFVWIFVDKCRREGPLIARINNLEQQLLATTKENEALQEKSAIFIEEKTQLVVETVPNEIVEELNFKISALTEEKLALEEQIQALEKELDNSTEVGIELNKIISEMLNSGDGSEILKENFEQMQKKLLEQQDNINGLNATLSLKETENHELRLELDITRKKVADLQSEVNAMVEKILKIEDEKDRQHHTLETEITSYQNKFKDALAQEHVLKNEIRSLQQKTAELQRLADIKVKEYNSLKDTLSTIKSVKNDKDAIKSFLDVSEIRAQLEQMKAENLKYSQQLTQENDANRTYFTQLQALTKETDELRQKYEKAEKEKVEINTKLEVLNNYFKEKEGQMQKEISKYESLWAVKEGEATSTTERIRYMQEELQNYKQQNENLKQEIVNQEVELKSQISMLEKKNQENWVTNRQTERKLEEARQEAALLRNRLTLRERAIAESNNHIRMQSPLHQNGELPTSPPPIDPTQSPPPLFHSRDHITKSPPIPGLPPPPFLPPPMGGAPFIPPPPLDGMMPPPLGDMPPFMHGLPPAMFPGDHRPPPLGRMSSPPPVGGRYTPESTVYSEYDRYDRRSPSPPYDSEYGASPPPIRGYSPYSERDRVRDDRRDYKRPQPRSNGRNSKGLHSSGSENDSLGKGTKKPQRKV